MDYLVSAWRKQCFFTKFLCATADISPSWAHEICAGDTEERAIVVASMNEMAYVLQAWLPLLVWQQIDAPQYQKGFITITCLSVALIVTGFITKVLHKRENLRFVATSGSQSDNTDQSSMYRKDYQSHAQSDDDETVRSSGEGVGIEQVQAVAKK